MARSTRTARSTSRRRDVDLDGVLVVGGGYAGVHAAIAARDAHVPVTVLDPDGTYDFLPRLASVAAGTMSAEDASAPLDEFVDEILIGCADRIDDGIVTLADGRRIAAPAIVVTAGAPSREVPIPGIETARRLRTGDDARGLREEIAGADALVVVGGGATGVQLASAAAVAHRDLAVTIIEIGPRVLSTLSSDLGRRATTILRARGVDVRTDTTIERITDHGVELDDGEQVAGLAVWTGGVAAEAERFGLPSTDDGRVVLEPDLRVAGWSSTFAAGDIAAHVGRCGEPLPASAQVAVRAGTAAGRNAARLVRGRSTESIDIDHLGWVLDLGGGRGVAEFGPVPLAAPLVDRIVPWLHGLIDARHLQEIGGLGGVIRHRTTSTG